VRDFQNWQSQVQELMLELVPILKEMGYLAYNLKGQEKKKSKGKITFKLSKLLVILEVTFKTTNPWTLAP
jgi:hypothetical protein